MLFGNLLGVPLHSKFELATALLKGGDIGDEAMPYRSAARAGRSAIFGLRQWRQRHPKNKQSIAHHSPWMFKMIVWIDFGKTAGATNSTGSQAESICASFGAKSVNIYRRRLWCLCTSPILRYGHPGDQWQRAQDVQEEGPGAEQAPHHLSIRVVQAHPEYDWKGRHVR